MSKRQVIMLIGAWVALFLFLGFPDIWDKWIAVVSGLLTVIIAYMIRDSSKTDRPARSNEHRSFVEHRRTSSKSDINSQNISANE